MGEREVITAEQVMEYRRLKKLIIEAKYEYYELSRPTMSDYDYDMLEKEYDKLAKEMGWPGSWVGYKENVE